MIDFYLQRHEHCLEQILRDAPIPANQIREAIHYALFPGGKRIRPVLVYLMGELIEVDLNALDIISSAIELTHCYSLIHDDLPAMDDDDLRRGKPSCHKQYNEATAILVGDGMQALAIESLLSRLPALMDPTQIITITQALVKASGVSGMVSGQSLDLSELTQPVITQEQLEVIHHLKTGQLISACVEMVLAAKKDLPAHVKQALRTYADHIGLVFQLQDDYLDHYAPATVLGKGRASDKANKKTTFATIWSQSTLENEIKQHYDSACNALKPFEEKAAPLYELTQQLRNRTP